MIYGVLYSVFLDGNFIGFVEDESHAWKMAEDHLNGIDTLFDDTDRVITHKIDVNRWYLFDAHNCSDKLSDDNIMCYNKRETKNCVKTMNKFNLEKERIEAKCRALLM